mgnify:CR=1 FL=1
MLVFLVVLLLMVMRRERERTGKQEQQKERREQKRKAGPYTLPNSRSPASGGNYHVKIKDLRCENKLKSRF